MPIPRWEVDAEARGLNQEGPLAQVAGGPEAVLSTERRHRACEAKQEPQEGEGKLAKNPSPSRCARPTEQSERELHAFVSRAGTQRRRSSPPGGDLPGCRHRRNQRYGRTHPVEDDVVIAGLTGRSTSSPSRWVTGHGDRPSVAADLSEDLGGIRWATSHGAASTAKEYAGMAKDAAKSATGEGVVDGAECRSLVPRRLKAARRRCCRRRPRRRRRGRRQGQGRRGRVLG